MNNLLKRFVPKGFLWRLTILNFFVVAFAMGVTSWAVYETACYLVDGISNHSTVGQKQFNATLFQYFLIFTTIGLLISALIHFYLTKRLITPINQIIASTKQLQVGQYPDPINYRNDDEIGRLITHYNTMIVRLKENEMHRKNVIDDISHELRTPA